MSVSFTPIDDSRDKSLIAKEVRTVVHAVLGSEDRRMIDTKSVRPYSPDPEPSLQSHELARTKNLIKSRVWSTTVQLGTWERPSHLCL